VVPDAGRQVPASVPAGSEASVAVRHEARFAAVQRTPVAVEVPLNTCPLSQVACQAQPFWATLQRAFAKPQPSAKICDGKSVQVGLGSGSCEDTLQLSPALWQLPLSTPLASVALQGEPSAAVHDAV